MTEEGLLQISVADYLRLVLPPSTPWSHFPAGEKRDLRTGAKLKRFGLATGWPDILILSPLICIELKAAKGVLSKSQKEFRIKCEQNNIPYYICRSIDEVQRVLEICKMPMRVKVSV